jgi:hypothetical protein
MDKKESTKKEYFNPSDRNPFTLSDEYDEIAFYQINRVKEQLGSYFNAASEAEIYKTYIIKGSNFLSIDYTFKRENDTSCSFQISNPYKVRQGTRIWTRSEENRAIWSTVDLLTTCTEPELLFRFFMRDWLWFERYIALKIDEGCDDIIVASSPSSIIGKYFGNNK